MAVLDRVPVDRIALQASALRLLPMLLSLLMLPFFLLGWSAAKVQLGLRFTVAAVMVGYTSGLGKPRAG